MGNEKTISLIASYNPTTKQLPKIIDEMRAFSEKIIIFTAEDHELDVDDTFKFDKSIEEHLAFKPRKWVAENLHENWDYVLYNEDDIFIPKTSYYNVIKMYNKLDRPFVPGFIRYEYDPNRNHKRYLDLHPIHSIHRRKTKKGSIKRVWQDKQIFEPWNVHSGNWLFSKDDVKTMIENDQWEIEYNQFGYHYAGILESGASALYTCFNKVYPYDVESVECKHPEKYIHWPENGLPIKEIKAEIEKMEAQN